MQRMDGEEEDGLKPVDDASPASAHGDWGRGPAAREASGWMDDSRRRRLRQASGCRETMAWRAGLMEGWGEEEEEQEKEEEEEEEERENEAGDERCRCQTAAVPPPKGRGAPLTSNRQRRYSAGWARYSAGSLGGRPADGQGIPALKLQRQRCRAVRAGTSSGCRPVHAWQVAVISAPQACLPTGHRGICHGLPAAVLP
ncbi:hypothetical protein CDD83_502 [Cordyceps sp. RAO-2017]|nr:hypothetical protein CDD83_502 [Cordyceps sp. RAO-2017]